MCANRSFDHHSSFAPLAITRRQVSIPMKIQFWALPLAALAATAASAFGQITIRVDFATNATTPGNWNNVTSNGSIPNLIDSEGSVTGIALATAGFQADQLMSPDPGVHAPTTANLDYMRAWNDGDTALIGTVTLTGLATDQQYTMTLFGSRLSTNGGGATRGGQYRLTGTGITGGTQTLNIVTVDNTNTFGFTFTTAATAGSVILEVQGYDFNTNAIGIGGEARGAALSSMQLVAVPEPSAIALVLGASALGCMLIRRRRS
jgi:hypothetical protein